MVDGIHRPGQWQILLSQRRRGSTLVPASFHRRLARFDYRLHGAHLHPLPVDQAAAVVAQRHQRKARKPGREYQMEEEGLMTDAASLWSIVAKKKNDFMMKDNKRRITSKF